MDHDTFIHGKGKEFLQGKGWWGEPIHPAMVHLPTGLWFSALVFDIISFGTGNYFVVQTAFWCLLGGCISAILAMPFGIVDWWDIKKKKPAHRLGLLHAGINAIAFGIFVADMALRIANFKTLAHVTVLQLILSIIGNIFLWTAVIIGGRMIYDQGTSVARFSKEHWRRMALAGGAAGAEKE
ncbi:MAG TPA: DUF2231 domain-containing protein [Tepidisphaeraceae bacterium]|nr:DUF2231 domain-containing protein [Tepidisphaeraceae bacterium]